MKKLVLIKHALPDIEKGVPSKKWKLSAKGKDKSRTLSKYIKKYDVACIYTSDEQKAIDTGKVICKELNLQLRVHKNLHENDRTGLKYLAREEYENIFRSFFDNPETRIVGNETANDAKDRFAGAVANIIESDDTGKDIVIVAHGTVMSLFASCYNDIDVFSFWNSLDLPSIVELAIPGYKIINVVNTVY
jgi:broad specificity phosphatase PhoE